MRTPWTSVLLVAVAGCHSAPAPGPGPRLASGDPAARFSALEERLLDAGTVHVSFGVTAEGVIVAELRGELSLEPDGSVRVFASGNFDGRAVDLLLECENAGCECGYAGDPVTSSRPPHLREAVVIGFTRMGILHNLARLTGSRLPDHAQGGVRDWVVVSDMTEDPKNPTVLSFDMTVAGKPAGSALLQIDDRGRPVFRRQTVQFSSGEMHVVEWYSSVRIDQ